MPSTWRCEGEGFEREARGGGFERVCCAGQLRGYVRTAESFGLPFVAKATLCEAHAVAMGWAQTEAIHG